MNAVDIKHGQPKTEGRYVAFIRCQAAAAADWVEPVIMTWAGGRWHSTFLGNRAILGWIGPLPVMKATDLQEFPGLVIEPGIIPLAEPSNLTRALQTILKPGFGETSPNPVYDL